MLMRWLQRRRQQQQLGTYTRRHRQWDGPRHRMHPAALPSTLPLPLLRPLPLRPLALPQRRLPLRQLQRNRVESGRSRRAHPERVQIQYR